MRLHKFALTALAAAGLSAGLGQVASAADMPIKGVRGPASVVYNWTGFYIGANLGYGWGRDQRDDLIPGGGFWTFGPAGIFGGSDTLRPKGWLYGGQLGFNYQAGAWVFGLEGMFNGANLNETKTSIFFPATDFWESKVSAVITVTGRIGYSMGAWLPYIKGGYAGARLKARMFDNTAAANFVENRSWYNGWTIGAGLEFMVAPNWTLGAEYNYMDFASRTWSGTTTTAGGAFVSAENIRDKLSISTVLLRLNYKFRGW